MISLTRAVGAARQNGAMSAPTPTPPRAPAPSLRSAMPPFEVMEMIERAARHPDPLVLCVGEPGGGAPASVRDAAREALTGTLGYTPAAGMPALLDAIAGHYRAWYDLEVDPGRVMVTTGASGGFMIAALCALEPGDAVALTVPGYPAYRNLLSALGAEVVEIRVGPHEQFRLTPAALERAHRIRPLRAVVLASPGNPTGTMLAAREVAALAAWCAEAGVILISDEIYHGLTYTGSRGACALTAGRPDHTVIVGSFSKYWGMTGWRLGWLVLPESFVPAARALGSNLQLAAPTLAQTAALGAFTPQAYAECDARVAETARAREIVLDWAPRLGWRSIAPPDGAFYLWAQVSGSGLTSREYCSRLLDHTGVALAPGGDFDTREGDDWVRLSFSPGSAVVAAACERIAAWSVTAHARG
ncbi:aspartate/methionine/tyrosine aminotransferase [Serinibacter salmoneus]|uniref:Aminotransferase n=2 Tax=Serinibacter salmoneus TaxID=556530 RepID=A0A2A9D199_9MICO|nr:aspartate/methionine/tyrosine aminotransferase [Serinibacter salmoneus]